MSVKDDIWTVALEEKRRLYKDKGSKLEEQSTVMFIGSKNAGKTSLILRFLEKNEQAKPTTGLEYTFGRRSKGANMVKEVVHIWELGGGAFLSDLIDLPISASTIEGLSIVLVLDLSEPEELWNTMERLLQQVRQRITKVMHEINLTNPKYAKYLENKAWKKYGIDHLDKDMINPLPIKLAIIGTKYDIFQDMDPEKRKTICKTLRFIAHVNGAILQFVSLKSESLVSRAKQVISHFAFGTSLSHIVSMDYTKPLIVPSGSDALGQIGVPPVPQGELARIHAKKPLELWKQGYCAYFPQKEFGNSVKSHDIKRDKKFSEDAIDQARLQKDKELENYRKHQEKKAKKLHSN